MCAFSGYRNRSVEMQEHPLKLYRRMLERRNGGLKKERRYTCLSSGIYNNIDVRGMDAYYKGSEMVFHSPSQFN